MGLLRPYEHPCLAPEQVRIRGLKARGLLSAHWMSAHSSDAGRQLFHSLHYVPLDTTHVCYDRAGFHEWVQGCDLPFNGADGSCKNHQVSFSEEPLRVCACKLDRSNGHS